ncbi:MAG TPA: protein kinase [Gemmatimonadaceae bacterium]|nr:protein kinase [Gemmatimonadaceae bacterium]
MLRLTALGGLTLLQDGQPHQGPASQRRRLALLARIATTGKRGVTRDLLVSTLWPGGAPEQARHALEQALSAIRRALNVEALFVGTGTLQLNPTIFSCDVAEFEDAVAQHAAYRAVALYQGPFLDGFSIDGAPAYDRWIDEERGRLQREYEKALEVLAEAAADRNEHTVAVQWRRKLASVEPLSSRFAVGLIEAMVAAGDQAGALRSALVHEELVRQELESEADPEVAGWISRLKAGRVAVPVRTEKKFSQTPVAPSIALAASLPEVVTADQYRDRVTRVLGDRYAIDRTVSISTVLVTFGAKDRRRQRPVHIHVVAPGFAALADGERMVHVFERVTTLEDQHVMPILDFGVTGDVVYYTTDPADGLTLKDRLARERPLPITDAARIADDMMTALAHAHSRGVRHGDLRPKHVVLKGNSAVVTSWALTDALRPKPGADAGSTVASFGAPAYLSPEQLSGESPADERSDLYSFGCILYEALVGEAPYRAATAQGVLSRKLSEPPPSPKAVRADVPDALDTLVKRCLARHPVNRIQSAAEGRAITATLQT